MQFLNLKQLRRKLNFMHTSQWLQGIFREIFNLPEKVFDLMWKDNNLICCRQCGRFSFCRQESDTKDVPYYFSDKGWRVIPEQGLTACWPCETRNCYFHNRDIKLKQIEKERKRMEKTNNQVRMERKRYCLCGTERCPDYVEHYNKYIDSITQ